MPGTLPVEPRGLVSSWWRPAGSANRAPTICFRAVVMAPPAVPPACGPGIAAAHADSTTATRTIKNQSGFRIRFSPSGSRAVGQGRLTGHRLQARSGLSRRGPRCVGVLAAIVLARPVVSALWLSVYNPGSLDQTGDRDLPGGRAHERRRPCSLK